MNKEEAAKRLGLTVKELEDYAVSAIVEKFERDDHFGGLNTPMCNVFHAEPQNWKKWGRHYQKGVFPR